MVMARPIQGPGPCIEMFSHTGRTLCYIRSMSTSYPTTVGPADAQGYRTLTIAVPGLGIIETAVNPEGDLLEGPSFRWAGVQVNDGPFDWSIIATALARV
jgi:hypothetical protein